MSGSHHDDGPTIPGGFSQRDFYLAEFRGRTLAFSLPAAEPEELPVLESVLTELEANRTRVIVLDRSRIGVRLSPTSSHPRPCQRWTHHRWP